MKARILGVTTCGDAYGELISMKITNEDEFGKWFEVTIRVKSTVTFSPYLRVITFHNVHEKELIIYDMR